MNMFTMAFETLKIAWLGEGFEPAAAVRIVITPCRSFKKFTHRDVIAKTDLTLTAIIQSHSFRFDSRSDPEAKVP
jgi:hypothetical protein